MNSNQKDVVTLVETCFNVGVVCSVCRTSINRTVFEFGTRMSKDFSEQLSRSGVVGAFWLFCRLVTH